MSSREHPNVRRFLDCSTAHLPKTEMDAIESSEFIVSYPNEYGAWVHVSEVVSWPVQENATCLGIRGIFDMSSEVEWMFPALVKVKWFAAEHGCDWIKFDRDAEEIEGLETFEWE